MTRLLRALALALTVVATIALPAWAAPFGYPSPGFETFPNPGPPQVSAASWILYDDSLDRVLASSNPAEERPMASVTKMMTGLLALENTNPDEIVTISQRAADTGEHEIGLVAGERLTMDTLFKAMMIHSANDAATAIAEHVSGTVEAFVDLMNQRAKELGMEDTEFANPHGLDAPGHYSSARDLLKLARVAMSYPEFADVVRARVVVIPPAPDGTPRVGTTTDLMLDSYPGTIGVKTGYTSQAQLTYVGAAERDGRRLYVVVLGSEGERGHFVDATALFNYGFRDLGYLGDVALGKPYLAAKARAQPDPLVALGSVETYLHLADQGLTVASPQPSGEPAPNQEPPTVEVTRRPGDTPTTVTGVIRYWVDLLVGA